MNKVTKLQLINERVNGSMVGTDSIDNFVDELYNLYEDLDDGLQVDEMFAIAIGIYGAIKERRMAWVQAMDLQDDEIVHLVNRSSEFTLGNNATEARQVVKQALVTLQSYDLLIHEKE